MSQVTSFVVIFGIVLCWTILIRARKALRDTTLLTAWNWSLLALVIWTITWIADRLAMAMSSAAADHAWYACAVFALCPPIAVLGSRRPGTRVWTWFILVPMLLVLGWPVGSLWLQGSELRGLQLEIPQLLAFCLVLVMGLGNYCGTRHTIAALLYGLSLLGIVASLSLISWLDKSTCRLWGSILIVLALRLTRTPLGSISDSRFDRLWFDYFDTFGIVWGRRIQDRINYQADLEKLPVRLELDGFCWLVSDQPGSQSTTPPKKSSTSVDIGRHADSLSREQTEARLEHIFRWLLRRFTDPTWIDERLNSHTDNLPSQLPVDS